MPANWCRATAAIAALAIPSCALIHDTERLVGAPPTGSDASDGGGGAGDVAAEPASGGAGGGGGGATVASGTGAIDFSRCNSKSEPCCASGVCAPGLVCNPESLCSCGATGEPCCKAGGGDGCDIPSADCCDPSAAPQNCGTVATTCMRCCVKCQGIDAPFSIDPGGACHENAKDKCWNEHGCRPGDGGCCGEPDKCKNDSYWATEC